VVPASASAEVMFRIVGKVDEVLESLQPLDSMVQIEKVLHVSPVRLHTIPGIPSASFPFTTDIPLLDRWGVPLLFGPGSFLLAHTDDEYLDLPELDAAIESYVQIVTALL
jgi:acetylornithine deacetylase